MVELGQLNEPIHGDKESKEEIQVVETSNDLSIRELKEMVTELLLPNDRYPLVLGDRGIAKTQVAFQVAKAMGKQVYYFNASQVDAESLVFPVIKEVERIGEDGKMVLGKAIEIVTVAGLHEDVVVIIDELTNARPSLHSFLLSFVADRRIGENTFENVRFYATGNKTQNSSLAQPLPRPLMERFCIIDAPVPSKEEWMAWMRENYENVPSWYYGFIHGLPNGMFYSKEEEGGESEDFTQLPSPRSHTYAATTLNSFASELDAKKHLKTIFALFKGYLGTPVASRFIAYIEDSSNFLTYEQYAKGTKPTSSTQVINLAVDAADKLYPLYETEKEKEQEKFYKALDKLLYDIHQSKFTNLTQFVLETVVNFSATNTDAKQDYVTWGRDNPKTAHVVKIIAERKEMLFGLEREFESSR